MRVTFLLVAVCALQGCTALGAGLAADTNRERRADATTARADIATRPPATGDVLTVRLNSGEARAGTVVMLTPDTLRLNTGAFALSDVDRVERPWRRAGAGLPLSVGAVIDIAAVWYLARHGLGWSGGGGSGWF